MANIKKLKKQGFKYICGVDEAGRGPLAGPLSLGFFVVEISRYNEVFKPLLKLGLNDSKKLSEKKREKVFEYIFLKHGPRLTGCTDMSVNYFNAMISAKQIDKLGISKCMRILIKKLLAKRDKGKGRSFYLLDGAIKFPEDVAYEVIIKGDSKEPTIMAASIVAKVLRDREMRKLAKKFPEYGFEVHKGYGTLVHRKAIKKFGLSEIHRRSFCKSIKR